MALKPPSRGIAERRQSPRGPITDWQWQVKYALGERNLPDSYMKYALDKFTGADLDPTLIDSFTAVIFVLVAILSVYLNFFRRKASVR